MKTSKPHKELEKLQQNLGYHGKSFGICIKLSTLSYISISSMVRNSTEAHLKLLFLLDDEDDD